MRKYSIIFATIALFVLSVFTTSAMCFAGADDIKARMKDRLPTIVQMKADGIIGENNKGYLEFVPGAAQKMQDVIADENKDRQMVYSAIAKQQSKPNEPVTTEVVGKIRAVQIAEKAASGEWVQDGSGKWYKK
jgi:uncharacterized protein YdbL (DUF1318 family)